MVAPHETTRRGAAQPMRPEVQQRIVAQRLQRQDGESPDTVFPGPSAVPPRDVALPPDVLPTAPRVVTEPQGKSSGPSPAANGAAAVSAAVSDAALERRHASLRRHIMEAAEHDVARLAEPPPTHAGRDGANGQPEGIQERHNADSMVRAPSKISM